jgi:hypothetical protein
VKTKRGEPVSGVSIQANLVRPSRNRDPGWRRGDGPPPEMDLESELRRVVERHKWGKAGRREATTGPDGHYRLAGIADGEYWIRAYKQGFEFKRESSSRHGRVRAGARVDFSGEAVLDVPVDIYLPGGSQPEKAKIHIIAGRSSSTANWSPSAASIRLTPGTYTLSATSGEDGEYRSDEEEMSLETGAPPRLFTFRLKGDTGIQGKVFVPEGFDVDYVMVWVMRCPGGRVPTPKELVQSGEMSWCHKYEGAYKYTCKKLSPGNYLVGASYQQNKALVTATVEVTDSRAVQDLTVPFPATSEYLIVRAFGPKGDILRDLEIDTGIRSGGSSSSGGGTAVKREDGSYLVMHHSVENWRHGDEKSRHVITAKSQKYGEKEVEYKRGEVSELKIQFREPAKLTVTITGYVGSEFEGKLRLRLEPRKVSKSDSQRYHGYYRDENEKKIDSLGNITLGPVEMGAFDLVMYVKKKRWESKPVRRIPVDLTAGKNELSVSIPALYSLTVVVDKAGPGTSIQLSRAGDSRGFGEHKETDKEGKATFVNLAAGDYSIQVWGAGVEGTMTVSVPAQSVVNFVPKPINALKVTVRDPGGYLAKIGFQSGDLVIGIDGMEFKNVQHLQALAFGSMSKEAVKMDVRRGGAKLSLTVDPKKLFGDPRGMGGEFEPSSRD